MEAILKVDEAYFQMKEVPAGEDPKDVDVPKDLSKDPSSQEGIMLSRNGHASQDGHLEVQEGYPEQAGRLRAGGDGER